MSESQPLHKTEMRSQTAVVQELKFFNNAEIVLLREITGWEIIGIRPSICPSIHSIYLLQPNTWSLRDWSLSKEQTEALIGFLMVGSIRRTLIHTVGPAMSSANNPFSFGEWQGSRYFGGQSAFRWGQYTSGPASVYTPGNRA